MHNYYVYVPDGINAVEINAEAKDPEALVSGNGALNLNASGNTVAVIRVTNGSAKQRYTITFLRESQTPKLTNIEIANMTGFTFDPSSRVQHATVPRALRIADLTITAANENDRIFVNGHAAASGEQIQLEMTTDIERFDIKVIRYNAAGDQVGHSDYTLIAERDVERTPIGPYLEKIMMNNDDSTSENPAVLIENFDKYKYEYTATNEGELVYLLAKAEEENVITELYNEDCELYAIVDNLPSFIEQAINSETGFSTFVFRLTEITAAGYENIAEYELTVYNTADPIATEIWVQNAAMEPEYNPTVREYDVKIGTDATSFTVNASINYPTGSIAMSIDGDTPVTGTQRTFNNLSLDQNTFTVVVTINDGRGSTGTYTLNVTRTDEPILEINLKDLKLVDEAEDDENLYVLKPEFDAETGRYTATIDYTDRTIQLIAETMNESDNVVAWTAGSSEIKLTRGTPSEQIMLPESFMTEGAGATATVYVKVTDAKGKTGTYTITIVRGERSGDENSARLENLVLTDKDGKAVGAIVFDPETMTYSVNAPRTLENLNVTATAKSPADDVRVIYNGNRTSENVNGKAAEVTLADGEKESYIFVKVSGGGLGETTYEVKLRRTNTAYLSDLKVTDTNPTDKYEVLDPEKFSFVTDYYEVIVDAIDEDIEFEIATTVTNATLSISMDGDTPVAAAGNTLKHTFKLALDKKEFIFTMTVIHEPDADNPDDYRRVGEYRVRVVRDTPNSVAEMQTFIKGRVRTYSNDSSAVITLFNADGEQVAVNADGLTEITADAKTGEFEIQPQTEGTYTLVIHRDGYLDYKIINIVVSETFVKVKYDFGELRLTAGNLTDEGDSEGVIDKADLKAMYEAIAQYEAQKNAAASASSEEASSADKAASDAPEDDTVIDNPADDENAAEQEPEYVPGTEDIQEAEDVPGTEEIVSDDVSTEEELTIESVEVDENGEMTVVMSLEAEISDEEAPAADVPSETAEEVSDEADEAAPSESPEEEPKADVTVVVEKREERKAVMKIMVKIDLVSAADYNGDKEVGFMDLTYLIANMGMKTTIRDNFDYRNPKYTILQRY